VRVFSLLGDELSRDRVSLECSPSICLDKGLVSLNYKVAWVALYSNVKWAWLRRVAS